MTAADADLASLMRLSRDAQGWSWTVARSGLPPLEGRAPSCDSARRTGRFAAELVATFDRIGRRSF